MQGPQGPQGPNGLRGLKYNYDKIYTFNSYIVDCMQYILSKTKEIAIAERRSDTKKDAEYRNYTITAINYTLVNLLDGMNGDNTKIPSILAKKIAFYFTGMPLSTKFEELPSSWPNREKFLLNLELEITMYLLLTLLFYSQNHEYITYDIRSIKLDESKIEIHKQKMKQFYNWFKHVFNSYNNIHQNLNLKTNSKIFKTQFSKVVDSKILKNIFDELKKIHDENNDQILAEILAETRKNNAKILTKLNDHNYFLIQRQAKANPFINRYVKNFKAQQPPPRRKYRRNQNPYETKMNFGNPTNSANRSNSKETFKNLPEPPVLPGEHPYYASSSISAQSRLPNERQFTAAKSLNFEPKEPYENIFGNLPYPPMLQGPTEPPVLPYPPVLPGEHPYYALSSISAQSHLPYAYAIHSNASNGGPSSKKPKTNNNLNKPPNQSKFSENNLSLNNPNFSLNRLFD